jgi:hypothetical protein
MDTIKVEPDSDSDCHQMCSQSDGYCDGLKQERQALPEVTSEAKVGDILSWCFQNLQYICSLKNIVTLRNPVIHHTA